jgi:sugar phosphate permease
MVFEASRQLRWTLAVFMGLAGRRQRRRRSWTFCLAIAAIDCIFMSFASVLGAFTVIVLMRQSVKELFGVSPPSPLLHTT